MSDESTIEIAKLLGAQLIERRDVKAIQKPNGGYTPVRVNSKDTTSPTVPWHVNDLLDHIDGKATFGHYLVRPDTNTVRCFAFDIDIRAKARPEADEEPIFWDGEEIDPRQIWLAKGKSAARADIGKQLQAMTFGLGIFIQKILDVKVLMAYSGSKGTHVYAILDEGTAAADARDAARRVLDATGVMVEEHGSNFFRHESAYPALQVEMFPKQDTVALDSFGNLMRLPLGINRKTGDSGFFLRIPRDLIRVSIDDPLQALKEGSLR